MMMNETRKRNRYNEGDGRNHKRQAVDRDDNRILECVIYRILCPDSIVGSVIGKSGKVINAIRQESKAKVKIADPFPGSTDRVIMVYCHVNEKLNIDIEDEFDEQKPLCAAQDGLLRVHKAIAGAIEAMLESGKNHEVQCQILVPSSQSASIIGKGGSTIKKLRSKAKAGIKIIPKDPSLLNHSCAMVFDNFVVINGDSDAVKKALYAVSAIMYKFSPKEEVPLLTNFFEAAPNIILPSDFSLYPPRAALYPNSDSFIHSRPVQSHFNNGYNPDFHLLREPGSEYRSSHLPMHPTTLCANARCEEFKLQVLCPHNKIGRVIGKGGVTIKNMRHASGAHVDVDDSTRHLDDCVVIINSTESMDDMKSMAVEAILLLQEKINDEGSNIACMRLFISSKVIGCIIGKSGSIITEIRKRSKADIRISKNEKLINGYSGNELVEITGEVSCVRDALIQIVLRLRDDALMAKDSNTNPQPELNYSYLGAPGLSMPPYLPSLPSMGSLGVENRIESGNNLGLFSSNHLYGIGSFPTLGEPGFGSLSSYPSNNFHGGSPALSTVEMLIPYQTVGKVLGKGGSNLANIRKISGAAVELADTKSGRVDRLAFISGTPEQIRSAQNLIQAFIMSS